MATFYENLTPAHRVFIEKQKIFFVGTAARTGRVNVSPKGLDSLRILEPNKIIWLNLTGSGNETAAHLLDTNRMTLMFCSFDEKPLILRIYGSVETYHERDEAFHRHMTLFENPRGARQIFELKIESVQTSCGFAVPLMEFKEERTVLSKWTDNKNDEELKAYQKKKNSKSIDGFPTGIAESK